MIGLWFCVIAIVLSAIGAWATYSNKSWSRALILPAAFFGFLGMILAGVV